MDTIDSNTVAIALAIVFMLSSVAVMFAALRPTFTLYALAAVVSLVGINIHLGVTLYLSRIVIIFFLVSILVRAALDKQTRLPYKFLSPFIMLFGLILLFQLISVLFSGRISDGLVQLFINLSVMAVFITVICVGNRVEVITKAVTIYLVTGLVQGLYGIYQVIGAQFNWPTYQTLMAGIPTANDRTLGGYQYFGAYESFRAVGFFSADVSHYAGYMAGVLILAIALLTFNRRSWFLIAVIVAGAMGLLFSLSRSGILAFVVVGIPSLLFLLWRVHRSAQRSNSRRVQLFLRLTVLGGATVFLLVLISPEIELTKTFETISIRMADLANTGDDQLESMQTHILTRLLAVDAFASSPLIGVGMGVTAAPWYSESYHTFWFGAHSHHLDMLGQTGLIGAGLQWLFMGLVARYMWHGLFVGRDNSLERHLLAGLLAAFVTIVLGNLLYYYYLNDFVWFLMGCGVTLSRLLILEAHKRVASPVVV